jgi:hypothetical protein
LCRQPTGTHISAGLTGAGRLSKRLESGNRRFFTNHALPLATGIPVFADNRELRHFHRLAGLLRVDVELPAQAPTPCLSFIATPSSTVGEEHDQIRRLRWLIESSLVVMGASQRAPAANRTCIVRLADAR